MLQHKHYILLIIGCLLSSYAGAQFRIAPKVANFKPEDYGHHNQNWGFSQSEQGLIYVANGDGILEFDGLQWNLIPTPLSATTLCLSEAVSGKIYVGAIGDLGYINCSSDGASTFTSLLHLLPDTLQDHLDNVWNVYAIEDKVFFRTAKELFVYNGKTMDCLLAQNDFHRSFKVNNELWIQDTDEGIFRYTANGLEFIEGLDSIIEKPIYGIIANADELTILTNTGLYKKTATGLSPFARRNDIILKDAGVFACSPLKNGQFAVGTFNEGVLLFNKNGLLVQKLARREGLLSEDINALFFDRQHQLWCGMNNGISQVYYNSPVETLQEGKGYTGTINSVASGNGNVYMATSQNTSVMIQSNLYFDTVRQLIQPLPATAGQCFQLLNLREGNKLVCTSNGTSFIEGKKTTKIHPDYSRVACALVTNPNLYAISGHQNLSLLSNNNGAWTTVVSNVELPDEALSIMQDPSRNDSIVLWLGLFSRGIAKVTISNDFGSSSTKLYGANEGIPERWTQVFSWNQTLRFGTDGSGLIKYDPACDCFVEDPLFKQFKEESIFVMAQAADGTLYMDATGKILINKLKKDGTFAIDSLTLCELEIGEINQIDPLNDGSVWFGGVAGIARLTPYPLGKFDLPLRIMLREVKLGYDSVLYQGKHVASDTLNATAPTINLAPAYNAISFTVVANSMINTASIEYRYRVVSLNEVWSEWNTQNTLRFNNLDPGEYLIEVEARDYRYVTAKAQFAFTIRQPWYTTWWAFALYGAFVLIVFLAAKRLIDARKLEQQFVMLEQEVKERTKEIRKQRDSIESQKNTIEQKNNGIMDSIRYAQRIQNSILPDTKYFHDCLGSAFVFYKPRDVVSGDFYWLETIDSKIYLAAADCTGHGVPGALISIVGYNQLRIASKDPKTKNAADLLTVLNDGFQNSINEHRETNLVKDGMDISLIVWDAANNTIDFAGANNPLIIVRPRKNYGLKMDLGDTVDEEDLTILENDEAQLISIKGTRRPIGIYRSKKQKAFKNHQLQLQKGDRIYLFTDGYSDQFGGENGKKFMMKNFRKLLLENAHLPLEEQKLLLENNLSDWMRGYPQVDDICVLGLQV